MLCAGDGYVDAVVLLNKGAWLCTHHRDKHDVEFATLRTVYRDHLLLHPLSGIQVRDYILLCIIRSNDVNSAFLETLLWNTWNFFVDLVDLRKLLETNVRQFVYYFSLKVVEKRSALNHFLTIFNIDKEEGCIRVEKNFCNVPNIATLDHVVIEEHVWHLHQGLMHAVLGVQEREGMSSLN